MNKILPIIVVGILVLSGLGTIALPTEYPETIRITKPVIFPKQPTVELKDDYLRINFDGANSKLMVPGKSELPIYITTFKLPKEAQNIKVVCTLKDTGMMKISGEIIPVVVYLLGLERAVDKSLEKDEQVYQSNELYPSTWYSYDVGRGLDGEDRVTFVKIVCNVVRYAPALGTIEYMKGIDITVTYDDHVMTSAEPDVYDMVIIAPEKFSNEFQPLINHKNSHGVNTTLKTVEEILDEYDEFDAPEEIKYFIKDAIEEWGITYVLLGGGLKSHVFAKDRDDRNQGTKAWHVPVRYTNIILSHIDFPDPGCISDLYYADIYDGLGDFCSWDSNADGIFAAWGKHGAPDDDLDLYPDVYIARLPCRNRFEVKILVKKIIEYESTSPDAKPWLKRMIGIGGKVNEVYEGQPDGEYVCDVCFGYMCDFIEEPVRVYASNRDTGGLTPIPRDIIHSFNGGAAFVVLQGHGTPISWNTYWHEGSRDDWTGGLRFREILRLFNGKKLPVVVVGGCHCGLFNVSMLRTMSKDLSKKYFHTGGFPTPFCFSWGLCLVPWGGAIGSTGCTGYGFIHWEKPIGLNSEMEANFFYEVGKQNVGILAQAHGGSITKFLTENKIDSIEAHCITIFHLFGDPSLKLGGY